jgi:hypothetical protein
MLKEIPKKGWYILKEGNEPTITGTKVYLDGKLVGGIQKLSIEIDAEKLLPIIKLEVLVVEGMFIDTVFGSCHSNLDSQPEIITFRSNQSPEQILKDLEAKEKSEPIVETQVL